MRWTATIIDGHEDAVHIVHEGAVLHRLTRIEARALAAELARAAEEVDPPPETIYPAPDLLDYIRVQVAVAVPPRVVPTGDYRMTLSVSADGTPVFSEWERIDPGHAPKVTT